MDVKVALMIGAAVVVPLTEAVKFSRIIPDRFGLLVAAVLSALGVWAWGYSQPEPFDRTQLFDYLSGFASVFTTALGVYGFVRAVRPEDTTALAKKVLLPIVLAAGLLAPACATIPGASPSQRFFISAAEANYTLATNARTLKDGLERANKTDCDLRTEGMQPCLSDDSWAHWKSGLHVAATYGEALKKAIAASDMVGARARVEAIIGVLSGLIDDGAVRLRPDDRVVAVALLTAARTAFEVLSSDGGIQ